MNNTNYILSDANTPKEFIDGIEQSTKQHWNVIEKMGTMAKAKIRRVLNFYTIPFLFLIKHPKARNIIAWQQFFGILSAFYNRYIFRRPISITIMTFIYKPKSGFTGKLFYKMVNSAISSKYVKNIIVFAQSEIEHYEQIFPKAKGKFHFVKIGIPVDTNDYTDYNLASQNYFFAAGSSNRDYDFLIKVFDGNSHKLKIACPHLNIPTSPNIEILSNCFGEKMKCQMSNSIAVLIPLKDLNISSGQLAFITAMQLGKPLIITDSAPTRSYLVHNIDAIVIPNNITEWRDAINKLTTDSNFYETMSRHNKERSVSEFSINRLGINIGNLSLNSFI